MTTWRAIGTMMAGALLVCNAGWTADTPSVSREIVVKRICDGLLFSGHIKESLTAKQRKEFLDTLRAHVAKIAPEILPERLDGVGDPGPLPENLRGQQVGQRMDQIIPQSVVVTSNDLALEKIRLKTRLMEILLLAKFQPIYRQTVTPETLAAVRKNIETFADKLDKHLQAQLVGEGLPFQKDQVAKEVATLRKGLLRQVGTRVSHALTQPVPEAKFDEILARLAHLINKAKQPNGAGGGMPLPASMTLGRIVRRAGGAFLKQSSDPRLTEIDANELVPGYNEAVRERSILNEELMRREMEERRQEMQERMNRPGAPPRMPVPHQ